MTYITSPASRVARRALSAPAVAAGWLVFLGASLACAQLTVLPTPGKSCGFVSAPEPGKWIVFATGFLPIQPTLVDGGKSIVFEGAAGDYAIIYLPPGDAQPVVQKVTLGAAAPNPQPEPEPEPVPGGKYRIVLWYDETEIDNLPQGQRDILTSLAFRDWLKAEGHVLLEVLDPRNFASGRVPDRLRPWLNAIQNDPLPRLAIAHVTDAGPIKDYPLPESIEACKALLRAPGAK